MPAAIVSIHFFLPNAARSVMRQDVSTFYTEYFDKDGASIGTSITQQDVTLFTSKFFDTNKSLLGTAKTLRDVTLYNTNYFDTTQKKVGSSITNQDTSIYNTRYFDTNNNQIATSHTQQDSSIFTTTYRFGAPKATPAKANTENKSTTHTTTSPSSPTMYRATTKKSELKMQDNQSELREAIKRDKKNKPRRCSIM